MTGRRQTTLREPIALSGAGLHSGIPVSARILPTEANTGLVFRVERDNAAPIDIPATLDYTLECTRSTALCHENIIIDTVEHILAALYGLEVDNAIIVVEGGELPALDGSAKPLVEAIDRVGLRDLDTHQMDFSLLTPVFVSVNGSDALAVPAESPSITVASDFREPVGRAVISLPLNPEAFRKEIAPARTPGFLEEWEALKAAGLARGATKNNVVLVLKHEFGGTLRWPDEVGRHKALDLIGDLALLGGRVRAAITTVRGGHALNRALVRGMQGVVKALG